MAPFHTPSEKCSQVIVGAEVRSLVIGEFIEKHYASLVGVMIPNHAARGSIRLNR
jgi:hypothetical protein